MRTRLLTLLVLAAIFGALLVDQAQAQTPYEGTADTAAIQGILAAHRSPIPWWTVAAFKANNPTFDVAGFLAVAWAESSLGKAGRLHNIGSIKGGPIGTLWRDLRVGVTRSGYNRYPDIRAGTRAAIRLIWERGYNAQLAAHNFSGFADRYYGRYVPGKHQYIRTLKAAHLIIVREAAAYGAAW